MPQFMFQAWPDLDRRWHWVIFTAADKSRTTESKRTFDTCQEAEWDAKRRIEVMH